MNEKLIGCAENNLGCQCERYKKLQQNFEPYLPGFPKPNRFKTKRELDKEKEIIDLMNQKENENLKLSTEDLANIYSKMDPYYTSPETYDRLHENDPEAIAVKKVQLSTLTDMLPVKKWREKRSEQDWGMEPYLDEAPLTTDLTKTGRIKSPMVRHMESYWMT